MKKEQRFINKLSMIDQYGIQFYQEYTQLRLHASYVSGDKIKRGQLPRLQFAGICLGIKCVDCGASAMHYDHRDYFKPFIVEPVCHRCNLLRGSPMKTINRLLRIMKKSKKSF